MKALIFLSFLLFHSMCVFSIENQIDSLGLKQGKWTEFEAHPSKEGLSISDLDDGESNYEYNYSSKRLDVYKFSGVYKDGYRNGVWNIYSDSNQLLFAINYNKGIIEGQYIGYDDNGDMIKCYISRTVKTKVERYTKTGELKEAYYTSTRTLLEYIYK
ncbi:hypothetical protein [Parabacteroides sp. FAFU027]|uniref:hypothetical protein n=1 Tax=Parabacteroides sp. FAFU027 TaxID=2922715 RepID=UPI001FB00599|nr:hypothetical protein [Parabacteroides sp. FAFU027]